VAIDDVWADEYATNARQEAARAAQRLLHECANIHLLHEDWKAARHQRLLDNIRSNTMSQITFKMCQFVLIIHLREYHYDFDLDIVVE